MQTQLSEPYFPIGKSSTMLQAIHYFPVNTGVMMSDPVHMGIMVSDPMTMGKMVSDPMTIEKPTIFTPKNIIIGAGVIFLLIVIVKSK